MVVGGSFRSSQHSPSVEGLYQLNMRLKQNTYGVDKNFLIALAKCAKVNTSNLVVKVQRSGAIHSDTGRYGNSSGICFRNYNDHPFIGMRITVGATEEQIGRLWLHELSHHRDNRRRKAYFKRSWLKNGAYVNPHKHFGGEKKADKFAETVWQKYLLTKATAPDGTIAK